MRVEHQAYDGTYGGQWEGPALRPSLVRWGSVFAGTVIALAIATAASLLWLALGYSSHHRIFYQHLDWWIAGTAIGAIFLAALIAGTASGTRGVASGLANGITTWALVILGLLGAGVPALIASGNRASINLGAHTVTVTTANWWPAFWAVVIGFGAGALGGLLGGATGRRPRVAETQPATYEPTEAGTGAATGAAAAPGATRATEREDARAATAEDRAARRQNEEPRAMPAGQTRTATPVDETRESVPAAGTSRTAGADTRGAVPSDTTAGTPIARGSIRTDTVDQPGGSANRAAAAEDDATARGLE